MKPKRHWLFKTIYLVAIGVVLFMKLSCRKFDSIDKTQLDNAALTERFFNAHKSNNPLTQQIASYFLRQNSKTGIATKIASNYGIAYWDKTLLFQSGNKPNGRSSSDSSCLVAYIPLLSNTDTTVNAQITVKLTTTDTVFEVLTSHEYAKFGFLPTDSSKLNGLKIFTMFANHDKNIFGYKKFKILDNRILEGQTTFTVNMNKSYIVELDTTTSIVSGRTYSLASPTPLPHSSCLMVKEFENAGYLVNYTTVGGVCVISSYGFNDDFTGDNGGSGGGGGGGSNTSGVIPPSGLGWLPIEDETVLPMWITDSLPTPCFKAALLKISSGPQNTFFKEIYNTFDTSSSLFLNIQEVDSIPGAYAATDPPFQSSIGIYINIDLNKLELKKCSQEFISYTLIHEVAHAAMFANIITWDSTNTQHENMISTYLNKMATSLKASYSTLTLKEAYSICFFGFKNAIDSHTADPQFLTIMLNQIKTTLNQPSLLAYDLDSIGRSFGRTGTKGLRNCN